MNPARILRWHYIAAAALVGHCAATSLNANTWWYGTGLFIAGLLLLVALARDIVAANRVCQAALDEAARMDRAARLRAQQDRQHAPAADCNAGPGWYEAITPRATTCIAYVHEDGSLYLPEGDLSEEEFAFAAARGRAHRLVRADDQPAAGARQDGSAS